MRRRRSLASFCVGALALLGAGCATHGQASVEVSPAAAAKTSALAQRSILYVIAASHLDTQWNWTAQDTIRLFVPATFRENAKLIQRFPGYVFNFEGAIHYMWMKEYYPEEWPALQRLVAGGRWALSGSWVNAADTNVPSPESLMRQALYGKLFFREEFGRVSEDIFLPDCFGFSWALPSIAAHSGLKAFSTQKLTWGSAVPPPFGVGVWRGVDGKGIVSAIRPGSYTADLTSDISQDRKWTRDLVGLPGGKRVGLRYFGVGDQGGAPKPDSVRWLTRALANPRGEVTVRSASADQLARDLSAREREALPKYDGELLLKTHGVGCYTSQAAMKRWNRANELLADAAEGASAAAAWLGARPYPRERLRTAWTRFLWHQFHDDLTGTSIPQAYQLSWNDELISQNELASVLTSAVAGVTSGLDTSGEGIPLVVHNPLGEQRRDPVEARVRFAAAAPAAVRVIDAASKEEVPSQVLSRQGSEARLLFLAEVPATGLKVFQVAPAAAAAPLPSRLRATSSSLENERYTVRLDRNGDLSSIVDREAGGELLAAPARLELLDNPSAEWPAWEILWDTVRKPARSHAVARQVRVVERGPVRVALEVVREAEGSSFVERVSLAQGGDRVDVESTVDWRTPGTLLKASFPLRPSAPRATYDLGLGTIERPNAAPSLYEVPAQQWADLTDRGGELGAAILSESKYGWDKPSDNTLRLTLIHTPRTTPRFGYQNTNDIGRHQLRYAVAGHAGDWRAGQIPSRASRFAQPLRAFQTAPHAGPLGRVFSLVTLGGGSGQVALRALKLAERGGELVVRVQELHGRPLPRLTVALPEGIASAREINAAEEPVGPAALEGGKLALSLARYQTRSFALRPVAPARRLAPPAAVPLALPFNLDGLSTDADRGDGDLDGRGRTLPAELMPQRMEVGGVPFQLGRGARGEKNVLVPAGQRLSLPAGSHDRLHLLAGAIGGRVTAPVVVERAGGGAVSLPLSVGEWEGLVGQWDSRVSDDRLLRDEFVPEMKHRAWSHDAIRSSLVMRVGEDGRLVGRESLRPGFVRRDELAWVATHRHAPRGNLPYVLGYLFKYDLELPPGARAIVLPRNDRLRLFALTLSRKGGHETRPATILYAPELPAR